MDKLGLGIYLGGFRMERMVGIWSMSAYYAWIASECRSMEGPNCKLAYLAVF